MWTCARRRWPPTVGTFRCHGDEVRACHLDAIVLARSPTCGNPLCRWRDGPVWGVQPHPEVTHEQIGEFLENNLAWFRSEVQDVDAMIRAFEDNEALAALSLFDGFLSILCEQISDDSRARAPQPDRARHAHPSCHASFSSRIPRA